MPGSSRGPRLASVRPLRLHLLLVHLLLALSLLVPAAGAAAVATAPAPEQGGAATAPPVASPTADPPPTNSSPVDDTLQAPATEAPGSSTAPLPPGTTPTTGPTAEPAPGASPGQPARLTTTPALRRSTIPLASVALALVVLVVGGLLVRTALRRDHAADGDMAGDMAGKMAGDMAGEVTPEQVAPVGAVPLRAAPGDVDSGGVDPATLDFLMALGAALVDSGDAIGHVQETLEEVAVVNGVHGVGIVVLPNALVVSLPDEDGVQTQVASPGNEPLRLDQVDALFRVVAEARTGRLSPSDGRVALAQVRAAPPPFAAGLQLLGYVLFTLGLVLILRGGWLELGVGAVVGVLVGALHLASERLHRSYQPFLPVVAALGAGVLVLTAARLVPDLAVFPPLVACLVAFLPGALLTTAVVELSTGQILSGSGRLAAGLLRLVLLALGILAGAQLVGVPGAAIDAPPPGAVTVLATWTGVAVFGLGVVLFKNARWDSLPWVLLVLYVAYAGQVVGGLLFGSTLSAFFGALVMTPVAIIAARRPTGPPALVSFLPGFWLLVPGAAGLEGVTQVLDDNTAAGAASLVTMGTSMVGIALGVLLGLVLGGRFAALTGRPTAVSVPGPQP